MLKVRFLRLREQAWFRRLELLVALGLMGVLFVVIFDWNMLRGPIERRLSEASGREFRIHGDLTVALSLHPHISLERLTLGNLANATEPQMASVERLQFRLDLLKLLSGEMVVSDLVLHAPRVLLERDGRGLPNWQFKRGGGAWPRIRHLQVSAGVLRYLNPSTRTDLVFDISSGAPSADDRRPPLGIAGRGRYAGNVLKLDGRVESPLVLDDPLRPYRIDVRAQAGDTHATAVGNLISPLQLRGFDLQFGLSGPSLARLFPLLGIAAPETPPYRLLGQLRHEAFVWNYNDFRGRVGDSDLRGDATVSTGRSRPRLVAELFSNRLDFDDLSGFVGAPPQTSKGETATAEQRKAGANLRASARVLPDRAFSFAKLRNMDADVTLHARQVIAPSLPIEAMTAHLFVDDAVLRLEPIALQVAGGEISGHIRLDARQDTIISSAKMAARGLNLPKLFPAAELTEDSAGRIGGRINLAGTGNSVARLLASADGEVSLTMGRGRISNLLMEYAGLDIAESLKFLIGKDRTIPIRCGFGDFAVSQGVMTTRALAFDTSDTVILGNGSIDLGEERLNLRLKPQPKDRSLFSLRAPLLVTGTFKAPAFRPDYKRIGLRGVAAGLLAALAPPAALLAVYERGAGKDVDCDRWVPPVKK